MLGNINYQVQRLFRESGINQIGNSKHSAKEAARQRLAEAGIQATWHSVGKEIGIFSYRTADAYRDIWRRAFAHAKDNFGLRDIEDITAEHVCSFLKEKVESGVSRATFAQYAAGLEKMETALNLFSKRYGRGREYGFSVAIERVRPSATALRKFSGSRAYRNPEAIIRCLVRDNFRLAALMQWESGARVHEISLVRPSQLQGRGCDPLTGREVGVVTVEGKGGKIRGLRMSLKAYLRLERFIEKEGEFRVNKRLYLQSVQRAAIQAGEAPNGSHGFRWSWAQARFVAVQQAGLSYEQALSMVSDEMGHVRGDITEHYLC